MALFGKKSRTSRAKYQKGHFEQTQQKGQKTKSPSVELLLCLFLGWIGAHKFYMGKFIWGVVYALTFGLFGIGWLGDCIILALRFFSKSKIVRAKWVSIASYALVCVLIVTSCGGGETSASSPVETTATTIAIESTATTVPETAPTTLPPTIAPTIAAETEAPATSAPTEATTIPLPTVPPTKPTEATVPSTAAEEVAPVAVVETAAPTESIAVEPSIAETKAGREYVLNTNTRKFHYPSCSSVDRIKSSNRQDVTATRDELISRGYDPCGRCTP